MDGRRGLHSTEQQHGQDIVSTSLYIDDDDLESQLALFERMISRSSAPAEKIQTETGLQQVEHRHEPTLRELSTSTERTWSHTLKTDPPKQIMEEQLKPVQTCDTSKPQKQVSSKIGRVKDPVQPVKIMRVAVGYRLRELQVTKNWLGGFLSEHNNNKLVEIVYCSVGEQVTSKFSYEISLRCSDGSWSQEVKVYYMNGELYSKDSGAWMDQLEEDREMNKLQNTKVILVFEGVVSQILASRAKKELGLKSSVSVTRKQEPVQLGSTIAELGTLNLIDVLSKLKETAPDAIPKRHIGRRSDSYRGISLFQTPDDLRNFMVRESVDYGYCGEIFMDSLESEELLRTITKSMLSSRRSSRTATKNAIETHEEPSQTDSLLSSASNSHSMNPQDDGLGCSSRGRLFLKKQSDIQSVQDDLQSIGSADGGGFKSMGPSDGSLHEDDYYCSPMGSDDEVLETIDEMSQDNHDESIQKTVSHNKPSNHERRDLERTGNRQNGEFPSKGTTLNKYWLALLQCIPTITEAKARGIAQHYQNGQELLKEITHLGPDEALKRLASIPFTHQKKGQLTPLGKPAASNVIRVLTCTDAFALLKPN